MFSFPTTFGQNGGLYGQLNGGLYGHLNGGLYGQLNGGLYGQLNSSAIRYLLGPLFELFCRIFGHLAAAWNKVGQNEKVLNISGIEKKV